MSDSRALVAEAIVATRIHPPARFTWFGRLSPRLPARVAQAMSARATRDHLACADRPMDTARSRRIVRLYWNLRADGAAPFVAAGTRLLNRAGAAFRLKVLNRPDAFTRCDAAVVYLARDDYPALADLLLALHAEVGGFLSPRTPVFTAELAPGLGLAEDPGTAESFGEHRCRLLADAFVRSHESGWTDDAATLAAVEARFARDGVDLDAPHLSPDPAADPVPVR